MSFEVNPVQRDQSVGNKRSLECTNFVPFKKRKGSGVNPFDRTTPPRENSGNVPFFGRRQAALQNTMVPQQSISPVQQQSSLRVSFSMTPNVQMQAEIVGSVTQAHMQPVPPPPAPPPQPLDNVSMRQRQDYTVQDLSGAIAQKDFRRINQILTYVVMLLDSNGLKREFYAFLSDRDSLVIRNLIKDFILKKGDKKLNKINEQSISLIIAILEEMGLVSILNQRFDGEKSLLAYSLVERKLGFANIISDALVKHRNNRAVSGNFFEHFDVKSDLYSSLKHNRGGVVKVAKKLIGIFACFAKGLDMFNTGLERDKCNRKLENGKTAIMIAIERNLPLAVLMFQHILNSKNREVLLRFAKTDFLRSIGNAANINRGILQKVKLDKKAIKKGLKNLENLFAFTENLFQVFNKRKLGLKTSGLRYLYESVISLREESKKRGIILKELELVYKRLTIWLKVPTQRRRATPARQNPPPLPNPQAPNMNPQRRITVEEIILRLTFAIDSGNLDVSRKKANNVASQPGGVRLFNMPAEGYGDTTIIMLAIERDPVLAREMLKCIFKSGNQILILSFLDSLFLESIGSCMDSIMSLFSSKDNVKISRGAVLLDQIIKFSKMCVGLLKESGMDFNRAPLTDLCDNILRLESSLSGLLQGASLTEMSNALKILHKEFSDLNHEQVPPMARI